MASILCATVEILLLVSSVNPTTLNQEEENGLPQAQIKEIQESGSMVAEYIWSVRNVHQLLLSTRKGVFVGPEFYTGRPGYKIRLSLTSGQINPADGFPYLGLWFSLETGLYDDVLDWPFPYTLNLTLLDRRKTGHRFLDNGEVSLEYPDSVQLGSQHPGTNFQSHGNSGLLQEGHQHPDTRFQNHGNSESDQLGSQPLNTGSQNHGYHDTQILGTIKQDWRPKSNQIHDFTLPNRRLPSSHGTSKSLERKNQEVEVSGNDSLLPYHANEEWNSPSKTNHGTSESTDVQEMKVSHGLSEHSNLFNDRNFFSQLPNGPMKLQNNDSPRNNLGPKSEDSGWPTEQRDVRKISFDTPNRPSKLSDINRGSKSGLTHENNFPEQPRIARIFSLDDNKRSLRLTHIPESGFSHRPNEESKLPNGPVNTRGSVSQIYKGPLPMPRPSGNSGWLDDHKDNFQSDVHKGPPRPMSFQQGINHESKPTGDQDSDRSIHLTITPSSVLCRPRKQLRGLGRVCEVK